MATPQINKTDKVYTLDIDGNTVHVFEGWVWNNLPLDGLKREGAFRAKIVNRRDEWRIINL